MNIVILKRNIEQVIKEPSYCSNIDTKANGISEDGSYIMVQVSPDDTSWKCKLTDNYVENILSQLPSKYREHLVTLRHDGWLSYSYSPVFDTDTQTIWDEEKETFMKAKTNWCYKYGCE